MRVSIANLIVSRTSRNRCHFHVIVVHISAALHGVISSFAKAALFSYALLGSFIHLANVSRAGLTCWDCFRYTDDLHIILSLTQRGGEGGRPSDW